MSGSIRKIVRNHSLGLSLILVLLLVPQILSAQSQTGVDAELKDIALRVQKADLKGNLERLTAMGRAGNCYAFLSAANVAIWDLKRGPFANLENAKWNEWSLNRDNPYNIPSDRNWNDWDYTQNRAKAFKFFAKDQAWLLFKAYSCGLKDFNFIPSKPEAIQTELLANLPKEHPLTLHPRAMRLGFTQEAYGLLDRSLQEGSSISGLEMAAWLIDGTLALPNPASAERVLVEVAEIHRGIPTSWKHSTAGLGTTKEGETRRILQLLFQVLNAVEGNLLNPGYWNEYLKTLQSENWVFNDWQTKRLVEYGLLEAPVEAEPNKPKPTPSAAPVVYDDEGDGKNALVALALVFVAVLGLVILNMKQPKEDDLVSADLDLEPRSEGVKNEEVRGIDGADASYQSVEITADDDKKNIEANLSGAHRESQLNKDHDAQRESEVGQLPKPLLHFGGAGALFLSCRMILESDLEPAGYAFWLSVTSVGCMALFGYGIKKLLMDPEGDSPRDKGLRAAGWGLFLAFVTSSSLPVSLDPNDLARLVLAIVMCCSVGFAFGYLGTTNKGEKNG